MTISPFCHGLLALLLGYISWTIVLGSPWHIEGGKGKTSEIVRFQIRPDPLAE